MDMERSEWAWSREANGYYIVDGLFLSPYALGAVHGDDVDDHCHVASHVRTVFMVGPPQNKDTFK